MKSLRFLLLAWALAVLFITSSTVALSQPCLTLYVLDDSTFTNPDSVMIDTCDTRELVGDVEKMWAKHSFDVELNYNIIPRDYIAPSDSIIEFTIQDILPIYTQAIEEFQALESKFGAFKFREEIPNIPDTTPINNRTFYIRFENYVKITEVKDTLDMMTCIKSASFYLLPSIFTSAQDGRPGTKIYPNPANEMLTVEGVSDDCAGQISMFNSLGERVQAIVVSRSGNKLVLNTAALAPGRYQLQINKYSYSFIIAR